jgi:hypothetical protein
MPRWTPEARPRPRQKIREWQPWTRSTGPRTIEGKSVSCKNRSPTDFALLPGIGMVRSDTRAGRLAIAKFELLLPKR